MSELTNQATSKDWLNATRDMEISAYPIYKNSETATFTRQVFEDALQKVSKPTQSAKPKRKQRTE